MAEYDFHFTAEVMDGIFGEVITARGAWDTLGERLDNIEQGAGGDTYTKTEVDTMLAEKVDKVNGKGLSTNDFTDSEKAQISANKAGIGAVANAGSKNLVNNTMTFVETLHHDLGIVLECKPQLYLIFLQLVHISQL
jgi:hypothetical protein